MFLILLLFNLLFIIPILFTACTEFDFIYLGYLAEGVVARVGGQEGIGAELLEAHRTLALRLRFLARVLLFHLLRRFLSLSRCAD